MAAVSSATRALARQVLLYEEVGRQEPVVLAERADHAYARLRDRLVGLIGPTGYTTLVGRAVRLAQAEVPALNGVTLDGWAENGPQGVYAFALASSGGPDAAAEGLTAILAHIIGLLVTFIGEDLAVRLVHEAWPELVPSSYTQGGHA